MTLEVVIEAALKLSEKERSEVIERLLRSLDSSGAADPGHEAAWTEVIDRRVQDIRDGGVTLIDAVEAFSQARAAVAAQRK